MAVSAPAPILFPQGCGCFITGPPCFNSTCASPACNLAAKLLGSTSHSKIAELWDAGDADGLRELVCVAFCFSMLCHPVVAAFHEISAVPAITPKDLFKGKPDSYVASGEFVFKPFFVFCLERGQAPDEETWFVRTHREAFFAVLRNSWDERSYNFVEAVLHTILPGQSWKVHERVCASMIKRLVEAYDGHGALLVRYIVNGSPSNPFVYVCFDNAHDLVLELARFVWVEDGEPTDYGMLWWVWRVLFVDEEKHRALRDGVAAELKLPRAVGFRDRALYGLLVEILNLNPPDATARTPKRKAEEPAEDEPTLKRLAALDTVQTL
jgi:hypothetical protein